MKICVTSGGEALDSQVDPRFGRCQFFIIIDADTFEFEVIQNPNFSAASGAGIQSAQLVAGKDVKAVLTGNVGPNAFQVLNASGIQVITGVTGTVKEAVGKFKKGESGSASSAPSVGSKFGMGVQEENDSPQTDNSQNRGNPGMSPGAGMEGGRPGGGMRGGRPGAGPGGQCVCPSCNAKVPHSPGVPCQTQTCPKCGVRMVRG